jgi:hypothetical protein
MDTTEIIKQSIASASAAGLNRHHDGLVAEQGKFLEPRYRVAFVGQFKTGKSTLINRLFLKEDILFTDVLEATAIPVEVDYADTKRLELFRYEKSQSQYDDLPVAMEYISGVTRDKVIDNPTDQDIKEHTSGETPEARAELATTRSHARLSWPAENLRRFTVVDTPGVNTTNEAVATATYRFLPECDLAIYVALPKALGQVDLQFLKGKVFECGITRAMIVLNYDPRFTDLGSDNLRKIKENVEATLKNIGRESIPVVVAEVPRKDSSAPGELARVAASRDEVDDWLNTPSTTPTSHSAQSLSSLENELVQFIQQNIQPGREEKIRARVRRILQAALAEIQIELGLLEQDAQTRQQTIAEIAKIQQKTQEDNQDIKQDFFEDFQHLQHKHLRQILVGFDAIEQKLTTQLDACESLGDIQSRLGSIKPLLQMDVESVAAEARSSVMADLKQMEENYSLRLQGAAQQWRDIDIALKLDGGPLEKLPAFAVTAIDYLLTIILSPFPFFIDIALRMLLNGFPTIAKYLPVGLAAIALRAYVKKIAKQQFESAKGEIKAKLQDSYAEAARLLEENWESQIAEQRQTVDEATRRAAAPTVDPARLDLLQTAADKFKLLLNQLPV